MKRIGLLAFLFVITLMANAGEKYWISFRDKSGVTFDPYSYFDPRTIEQRLKDGIPLDDSTDYPVNSDYLSAITNLADSITYCSRWMNGVAAFTDEKKSEVIRALPFVKSVVKLNSTATIATITEKSNAKVLRKDVALLKFQTARMQGDTFTAAHLDGSGIRIAVFDAGFPNVDRHPAFKHIRDSKRIVATYDFVKKEDDVYHGHWHGAATLSCIGGIADGINIGMATGAEFMLARTERAFGEPFSEEENWVAAAEWADKHGANIISSSLGYGFQRYFTEDMDGHTSLVSRAATIAASKGILVVNAAGNEGSNSWHDIIAPGDADSVLTIGGIDPYKDIHIYFSSFGPSAANNLKPNVSALGEAIVATTKGYARKMGTSFATPLVAGFAACAWQSHRQWTNMELFDAIEKSSHLYPYFDYAHGFGIPQAGNLLHPVEFPETTFDFVIINNDIKVILREKYSYAETEEALGYNVRRNFYYKVENKDGIIKRYTVLLADRKEMLHFLAEDFQSGDVLTVHFEGYTSSIDFPDIIKEGE